VNADDAEEYTQALGQVVAGGWRQVALGERLGVPAALGLTTRDWVEQRLGGYVRLSIPERQEAVAELTADGMTQREVAAVLGVGKSTVDRDLAPDGTEPEPELPLQAEPDPEPAPNGAEPEPQLPLDVEPEPEFGADAPEPEPEEADVDEDDVLVNREEDVVAIVGFILREQMTASPAKAAVLDEVLDRLAPIDRMQVGRRERARRPLLLMLPVRARRAHGGRRRRRRSVRARFRRARAPGQEPPDPPPPDVARRAPGLFGLPGSAAA